MFNSPAWQQPNSPADNSHPQSRQAGDFDLRNRVKQYAQDSSAGATSRPHEEPTLSPTDAFFGGPVPFADHISDQKPADTHPQKHGKSDQRDPEKPQKLQKPQKPQKPQRPQEHRPSLGELQATASPDAKELIDRIVANSDRIYGDALNNLSTSHKELAKAMIESSSENDRIVHLLHTTEKKIIKVPAETRITDERTGEEIQVGQRVSVGKDRVSIIEAEVASLWEQWEAAQKEVDDIKTELSSAIGDDNGAQSRSTNIVQESLAAEMAKFEAELTAILEDMHEDARTSEKGFSKQIKGVMSALLQQYFLED